MNYVKKNSEKIRTSAFNGIQKPSTNLQLKASDLFKYVWYSGMYDLSVDTMH